MYVNGDGTLKEAGSKIIDEHSTGLRPWYHSRPKGREQAALALNPLSPDIVYIF
jgi:hypothetical protein